jgi:23S rRNA (adenine2503-C2)-methyltransferase
MKYIKNIQVPTGNICIVKGDKGYLEFLSIGDYGKEKNIKADFMGLKHEINGVPHGDILPLSKKWVITISTQYGCSMNCTFCDVPNVGKGRNATFDDLINQVKMGIGLHPEITHTDRLNVHFARMGEPTFNFDVIYATKIMNKTIKRAKGWGFHPVVSTMCPSKNKKLYDFMDKWITLKNGLLQGDAGLQLSINTTNEAERKVMFSGNAETLENISLMFERLLSDLPFEKRLKGRKYTLNFAITDKEINAAKLRKLFTPKLFLCKITPMHETTACNKNKLHTKDGYKNYYPYKKVESDLKNEGFNVIVFIPSKEEDESKITCGNAILSNKSKLITPLKPRALKGKK